MEEIIKNFEAKKAEALKQPEVKESGLSPEKEKEILKDAVYEKVMNVRYTPIHYAARKQPKTAGEIN